MDLWLYPENPLYSNLASLILGALLLIVADVMFSVDPRKESREERRIEKEYAPQE